MALTGTWEDSLNGSGSGSANVEDSVSSLFREIGSTLKDVTKQGISTVGETVRTALANKVMASPEGQAQIAAYKLEYIMKYLPWLIFGAVLLFFGGRFLARR